MYVQFFTVYTCRSKRTSCTCICATAGPYGGQEGTAFVDITTDPCSVDITDIWVYAGDILDGIQVRYRFPDGHSETMPRRGAIGGFLTHIAVPQDGKVIAITGAITTYSPNVNVFPIETAIAQLRIIVLNNSSDVQIYGPFGAKGYSSTFAMYGDIKSLFGYYGSFAVHGLGVYYEP